MVPFGDFHISFRPNSFTRASSGVMVAHLTPTPTFLMALAASMVTWSSVLSRYSIPRSKYIRFDIEERVDQLVLDVLPDDPGHLVAIEFDDGVGHLDFCHAGSGLLGKRRVAGRDGVIMSRRYSTADAAGGSRSVRQFQPIACAEFARSVPAAGAFMLRAAGAAGSRQSIADGLDAALRNPPRRILLEKLRQHHAREFNAIFGVKSESEVHDVRLRHRQDQTGRRSQPARL